MTGLPESEVRTRGTGLFRFLRGMAELRNPPVRDVRRYADNDGEVLWLSSLPAHKAIRTALSGRLKDSDRWLEVDKLDLLAVPTPPKTIADRVTMPDHSRIDVPPMLRPDRDAPVVWDDDLQQEVPQPDPGADTFAAWIASEWEPYAAERVRRRPVAEVYQRLFRVADRVEHQGDAVELVLGFGLLSWHPEGHEPIQRHLFTVPASVKFYERSGKLKVRPAANPDPALELEMMDPRLRPSATQADLEAEVEKVLDRLLDGAAVEPVLRQIANIIAPDALYDPQGKAPSIGPEPRVSFAPALILRRRSSAGQVRIFDTILADLETNNPVPAGIRQLVDEDAGGWGAESPADPEFHLPLAANDEQLEIVRRVNHRPFTIVQGPPGTGKTHTIANLLSHLLAQGKRVLVTAETDRALRELRAKLPEELQQLCVSVIGTERADRESLRVAIDSLATASSKFDDVSSQRTIETTRVRLQSLKAEAAQLNARLVQIRAEEVDGHDVHGYSGSLSGIARDHQAEQAVHDWIEDYQPSLDSPEPKVSGQEIAELAALWADESLAADEAAARHVLPDPDELRDASTLGAQITLEASAIEDLDRARDHVAHPAHDALAALPEDVRDDVAGHLSVIAGTARELLARPEQWIDQAVRDVTGGRPQPWQERYKKLREYEHGVRALLEQLPLHVRIRQDGTTARGVLRRQAQTLADHLGGGGKLKRFGMTPGPVKEAAELLAEVTVNDLPPDSADTCRLIDTWLEVADRIDAMDALWPREVDIPEEDTPQERVGWHTAELGVLEKVLSVHREVESARTTLTGHGIPQPRWSDLDQIAVYGEVGVAAAAGQRLAAAVEPITALLDQLHREALRPNASPLFAELAAAVASRDAREYATLLQRTRVLKEQHERLLRRDDLAQRLRSSSASLAAHVADGPDPADLQKIVEGWELAWRWALTARWIRDQITGEAERIQGRLKAIEVEIERHNGQLVADLAWQHAVGRLDGRQQSNLRAYANAASKIPKTRTAKTRPQRLRDAQAALRRCREAVPSWVMPLYRIAESMDITRDAFDVIIIDEASQADTGASFLQYLAPQVVVVGDDKQVSPTGVGIKEDDIQRLRQRHLPQVPHAAVWADAASSYFEICDIYFSDRITLREHFRCMPEIIGFSNSVVYEPDGIPLIPLKQFGGDRLPPLQTVHVPDGWEDKLLNRPEVIRVADLVEKLVADPAYDGKTFGVITLVGDKQHKAIEQELLARLEPEEYRARDLRCGKPPDFQGSERDVIILSMVSAMRDSGKAPVARTTTSAVQRYNVATSRAKEQMWVVHSIEAGQLGNPDDLRYQLLSYCAEVAGRSDQDEDAITDLVETGHIVAPFDSVFEQQVCNALTTRGFQVVPQYDIYGHRLDLVVVGDGAKVAIECDGDRWDGPGPFEADLRRQRQLERCGWPVLRIRESLFTLDAAEALAPILDRLAESGIAPSSRASREPDPVPPTDVAPVLDEVTQTSVLPAPPPPPAVPAPPLPPPLLPPAPPPPPASPEVVRADLPTDRAPEPPAATQEDEAHVPDPPLQQDDPAGVDELPDVDTALAEDREVPPEPEVDVGRTVAEPEPVQLTPDEPEELTASPYVAWSPSAVLTPVEEASREELIETLLGIVAVEGPVVGERMYQQYVRASGGKRVGGRIARALNAACSKAERDGNLVGDDPLGLGGQKLRSYRLPEQPETRIRELGDRDSLDHVPPREIAAVIAGLRQRSGLSGEDLHREVLAFYGIKRYTEKAQEMLRDIERTV